MDNKTRIKILELSFNIMENLLVSKDFKDKAELMAAAKKGVDISNKDENMPIELGMISKAVENAQKKVEGRNVSIRKHVLSYDDVMNTQREIIYKQRIS